VLSSHTQLSFHSLSNSLKLCSQGFIGFLLEFDFKKPLSHLFSARKEMDCSECVVIWMRKSQDENLAFYFVKCMFVLDQRVNDKVLTRVT